jgi:hypothetical protein
MQPLINEAAQLEFPLNAGALMSMLLHLGLLSWKAAKYVNILK